MRKGNVGFNRSKSPNVPNVHSPKIGLPKIGTGEIKPIRKITRFQSHGCQFMPLNATNVASSRIILIRFIHNYTIF